MSCNDCTKAGTLCPYHLLVSGENASIEVQALAIAINPGAFTMAQHAHEYHRLHHPDRGDKFDPWTERAIIEAYRAAYRVLELTGWRIA